MTRPAAGVLALWCVAGAPALASANPPPVPLAVRRALRASSVLVRCRPHAAACCPVTRLARLVDRVLGRRLAADDPAPPSARAAAATCPASA